jgi:hypothetical protein
VCVCVYTRVEFEVAGGAVGIIKRLETFSQLVRLDQRGRLKQNKKKNTEESVP